VEQLTIKRIDKINTSSLKGLQTQNRKGYNQTNEKEYVFKVTQIKKKYIEHLKTMNNQ
jgi:hypothetical protein